MPALPPSHLEDLLASLFEPAELRRVLRRLGSPWAEVVDALPAEPEAKAIFMHKAALALGRRGLVDQTFLEALAAEFPARRADIERVAGVTLAGAAPVVAPAPTMTPARASAEPVPAPAASPWRPVRVLHLSDLHFDEKTAWDAGTVLERLAKDVTLLRTSAGAIDLVVVTGDVANKGRATEYAAALRWLDGPLRAAAGVNRAQIWLVPGNHDVDRGGVTRTARALATNILEDRDTQQAAAEVLGDVSERAPLLQRKTAWQDFAREFHPDLQTPWWSKALDLGPWKVHLAGFDSALLAASDQDRGQLLLSRWQCHQVLAGADEADLCLALLHHPWDYLTEHDRGICEEEIRRRCGVILHGHLHQQKARLAGDPDRDVLQLAAGACYAGSSWSNSYQLLELDPGRGEARVHFRVWDGHDWIPDRNRYQKAPNGVATLPLRRSPRFPAEPAAPAEPPSDDPEPALASAPDPLADYKQQLVSRADVLAQVFRAPGGPSALSKVYVEVRLSAEAGELDRAGEEGPFGRTRPWMKRWLSRKGEACALPSGRFKLEELVADAPAARWAVLGDPGGGKTTLLRHTALVLLEQGERLPVLLKVSELRGTLPQSAALVYGANAEALVREALQQRRAVVLIDGMDEVTDREAGLAAVRRAATEAGQSPLVLASRPIGWQRPGPDFAELALCPLGREEQRQLLDVWVDDPGRVARALSRLESTGRLRRLAENPLLLTLVALLLREHQDIPERRGELYDKAITILLTRASDPQRAQRRLREPDLAKQALAYAALKLHGRSEEVYRTADLLDALQEQERHRANLRELWGGPGAFLTELAETTGLLVPTTSSADGAPAFAFPHRTFREHLAAVALERDLGVHGVGEIPVEVLKNAARKAREASVPPAAGELGRVLAEARARPERWSEVLALVCALVGPGAADALVRRLAAEGNAPLLQRVVAEAEGLSSDTVLAVLGVERGWERWEERQKIIQEIPALVGDAGVAVRLLDRLRRETRDGNDLYWIRETLRGLEKTAGVDADAARDAAETVRRIFDHIPAPDLEKAKSLLAQWWRTVPPEGERLGPYKVGSEEHEGEKPVHDVTLTSPFQILSAPVTWEMYLGFDPDHAQAQDDFGGRLPKGAAQAQVPVYNVTWYAATMFAAWAGARLPAEAEWEIACRAGTTTRYWSGDQEADLARVGWYDKNSDGHPHPVAQKPANAWGLHDVHGNVWEWCLEWYQGDAYAAREAGVSVDVVHATYAVGKGPPVPADSAARGGSRVLRGGSWSLWAVNARSAYRHWDRPSNSNWNRGFRLVLPVAVPEQD